MRKILQMAMLFMALFVCFGAKAQSTGGISTIKGTVSDDQGVTLPGVTITLKGSSVNAATTATFFIFIFFTVIDPPLRIANIETAGGTRTCHDCKVQAPCHYGYSSVNSRIES